MKIYFKNTFGMIYLIIGIFCFINGIAAKIYNVSFSNFFLVLSVPLLGFGIFELLILNQDTPNLVIKFLSIIHIGTFLLFISFIVIEVLILSSAFKKETKYGNYKIFCI